MTQTRHDLPDILSFPPTITNNNLADIIYWLKHDDYVVIHNNYQYGRFFHQKCPDNVLNRVIYINISSCPTLLYDGEWEWYIKNSGCMECTCDLKTKTSSFSSNLKYVYNFNLN